MACMSEQLPKHTPSSHRKGRHYVKRQTAKRARRDGKDRLQDAAPRRTRGWHD